MVGGLFFLDLALYILYSVWRQSRNINIICELQLDPATTKERDRLKVTSLDVKYEAQE